MSFFAFPEEQQILFANTENWLVDAFTEALFLMY